MISWSERIIEFQVNGWGCASGHFTLWNGSTTALGKYWNNPGLTNVKLWIFPELIFFILKTEVMRTWLAIFSLLILNEACGQEHRQKPVKIKDKIEKERLSLKNAAFCSCLYKSFPQKDSVFINDGSAAGYLELGAHSIEVYTKVTQLGADHAKIKYNSKDNKDLSIMKCLDFYNSKELDDLVKSFDSQLNADELSDKH